MNNQEIQEEATIEQLKELIYGLDYTTEIGFETVNEDNMGVSMRCIVEPMPLEKCEKYTFCFEYERKTKITISYEIIEKIIIKKYFNGLWYEATIKCKNDTQYKLRV